MISGPSFDAPRILLFLWIPLSLAAIGMLRYGKRVRAFRSLLGSRDEALRSVRGRYIASVVLYAVALGCAIVAFSGPRWGRRWVPEFRSGLDVVLAFDVSRSMGAQDIPPSRLERAKRLALLLIDAVPGVRFATVAGKGESVLALPLTEDKDAVATWIGALGSRSLFSSGTDLEHLAERSLDAFIAGSPASRYVILFSDGEALSGSIDRVTSKAIDESVTFIGVGIGSAEGAPVPQDPERGGSPPLMDGRGLPVLSYLHPEGLTRLAQRTGGIYVDGTLANAGSLMAGQLKDGASSASGQSWRVEARSRSSLFFILALMFLLVGKLLEMMPSLRGGKRADREEDRG